MIHRKEVASNDAWMATPTFDRLIHELLDFIEDQIRIMEEDPKQTSARTREGDCFLTGRYAVVPRNDNKIRGRIN
jgi:hypothetical protein